jgi:hypothetical protein
VATEKMGRMTVEHGKPLRFDADLVMPAEREPLPDAIGQTIRRYREACKELLTGRYTEARAAAPWHMQEPCDITVLRCTDGIIVRYDGSATDKPVIRLGRMVEPGTLEGLAPILSDYVLYFPSDRATFSPSSLGPRMTLAIRDQKGTMQQEVATVAPTLIGSPRWPEGVPMPKPPSRPPCLASLINEFEMELGGVIGEVSPTTPREIAPNPTNFLAVARFRLPVGWRAIEVYPDLAIDYWNPDHAASWAENDLLFCLLQRNAREGQLLALDGRGAARKKCAETLAEFASLLDGPEEPVHQFLKRNPVLLSPTHVQAWSKVPFGDRFSDFVIREIPNEYTLVEIEAPRRELFRQDGQPRAELTHAIDQINDWLAHIADNRSRVEAELGLTGISVSPKSLVVIGRSATLSDDDRRKLRTIQERQPRLQIMTYDDVLAQARTVFQKLLGPLDIIVPDNVSLYYYPG